MRVPTQSLTQSLASQLERLNARQYRLQNQASTGQRVQWSADDPTAMQRALTAQQDIRDNTQYAKNIGFLEGRAAVSIDTLRSLQRKVDNAAEIAVKAGGARSDADLRAYAGQIDQIIRASVEAANAQHQGAYVLGGTRTNQPPFTFTESADGQVAAVSYQGNTGVAEIEIAAGTSLAVLAPGANTTGSGPRGCIADTRTGADLFAHLIALRDHLLAGDTKAIAGTDREALTHDEEGLLDQIAATGAVQSRLQTAATASSSRSLALQRTVSNETDADLAQTLVALNSTQTAYQAALQSGATLLRTSLMDYLR
jgi:flagellar hook-associated protein 3 FlgL